MPVNDRGFAVIDLPPVPESTVDSYDTCPLDEHMGNQTRYKRFSQYRLSWTADDDWLFDKLPHRDYTAFKKFNPVGGGIRRPYEPIQVDFTPVIRAAIRGLGLDTAEDWQINVHQNRSIATLEKNGVLTPEGVHHDGHEFVMIAILRRHSVSGGETRLWNPGEPEPFWHGILPPGKAVLLDDRKIAHDVTDIEPADGNPGYRDILITAFSRWKEKWYGDEHDRQALADQSAPTAM